MIGQKIKNYSSYGSSQGSKLPEKLPFFVDKGNVSDQRRIMVVKKVVVLGLVFELEVVEGKHSQARQSYRNKTKLVPLNSSLP